MQHTSKRVVELQVSRHVLSRLLLCRVRRMTNQLCNVVTRGPEFLENPVDFKLLHVPKWCPRCFVKASWKQRATCQWR